MCSLLRRSYKKHVHCHVCGISGWRDLEGKKNLPHKMLRYVPIIPRLQRFFYFKGYVSTNEVA
jgi:hypothetical protein